MLWKKKHNGCGLFFIIKTGGKRFWGEPSVEKSLQSCADSYAKCFHLFHRSMFTFKKKKKAVLTREGASCDIFPMQNLHATLRRVSKHYSQSRQAGRQAGKAIQSTVYLLPEYAIKKFADFGEKKLFFMQSGNTKHYRGP